MTVFKHELRTGRTALIIWTASIGFMLGICILIYPEMAADMNQISSLFSNMGSFSQAFGMDKINFGAFLGFFSVECGNVLGLGGAFYAALTGISALAKEEKEHTAEFLLTHPISRTRIIAEKLLSVFVQILILNIVVITITIVCILIIGEDTEVKTLAQLFLAYFLMQLEIGAVTFGISAFIQGGSLGIGLGLAACLYFLNIVANLIDETKFLKYITPFGYTEGADIIANNTIHTGYLTVGMVVTVASIVIAFIKYAKKDIK